MQKNMHVVITPELHEKLRKTAAEEGRHMRHIVEKAVRDELKRRELTRPCREQS
jgi:predicted transcriptional regulator